MFVGAIRACFADLHLNLFSSLTSVDVDVDVAAVVLLSLRSAVEPLFRAERRCHNGVMFATLAVPELVESSSGESEEEEEQKEAGSGRPSAGSGDGSGRPTESGSGAAVEGEPACPLD